jgi:hypothetical protein
MRAVPSLGLALAATAGGCGLGDYEVLIARTAERMQYVDEENQLLDEPVQFPESGPKEVYWRPPRGLAIKPTRCRPPFDWLSHLASEEAVDLPPLEAFIGVRPRGGERLEDALKQMDLLAFVRERYDTELLPLEGRRIDDPPQALYLVLPSEPPARQLELRYDRLIRRAEEKPPWKKAPPGENLPVTAVFTYEINVYGNFTPASNEYWVVIIFKQLNRAKTEEKWPREFAELFKRLPPLDLERVQRQKELSLASLRLGSQAKEYFERRRR